MHINELSIVFLYCAVFFWSWYQGNDSFIKCIGKYPILFSGRKSIELVVLC